MYAITANSGVTNSNVTVQNYANVSVGNVLMINNAGIYVNGNIGFPGSILASDGTKVYWTASGGFAGGAVPYATIFANTIPSISSSTGAVTIYGGLGVGGNVYAGGNVTVQGNLIVQGNTYQQVTEYITTSIVDTGSLSVTGLTTLAGISMSGNINTNTAIASNKILTTANVIAASGVAATGVATGALQVTGGASISGSLYTGGTTTSLGNIVAQSGTTSTSTTTGALVVNGGLGVTGAAYIGSVYDSGNRVLSTSSGSGNLTISGTAVSLTITGPGAVTTGSATAIPVITTDTFGRISSISTATVSSTLPIAGTSGTGSVSLLTQTLTFAGTNGVTASASGQTVTIGTPQNLQTSASPSFAGLTLTGALAAGTNSLTGGNIFIGSWPGNSTYNTVQQAGMSGSEYGLLMGQTDKNTYLSSWTGGSVNIRGGGNSSTYQITVGTASISITGTVTPSANTSYNLGSTTAWWGTIYGTASHAQYADLAENYAADGEYDPGTVVVFGGPAEITVTTIDHDPAVAGIISTDPAYLMNSTATGLPVALQGRVPCRVLGPVKKGQVLVTSSIPGVAQAIDNSKFVPGCVIGKALAAINTNNIETIEVVVGKH